MRVLHYFNRWHSLIFFAIIVACVMVTSVSPTFAKDMETSAIPNPTTAIDGVAALLVIPAVTFDSQTTFGDKNITITMIGNIDNDMLTKNVSALAFIPADATLDEVATLLIVQDPAVSFDKGILAATDPMIKGFGEMATFPGYEDNTHFNEVAALLKNPGLTNEASFRSYTHADDDRGV